MRPFPHSSSNGCARGKQNSLNCCRVATIKCEEAVKCRGAGRRKIRNCLKHEGTETSQIVLTVPSLNTFTCFENGQFIISSTTLVINSDMPILHLSWGSSGGITTTLRARRSGATNFLISKMSRPAQGPTQHPTQWESGFFPGDKAAGA